MINRLDILIIEDNPDDVEIVRLYLIEGNKKSSIERDTTYSLISTDYIEKAILILNEKSIDIILLDMNLPDAEGLSGISKLMENKQLPPVIMLTGVDDKDRALDAIRLGAQDYIPKNQLDRITLERSIIYALERNKLFMLLKNLALMDELTHLFNRRGFLVSSETKLKLAEREKRTCMIAYCDLDFMKNINDNYGHSQGDIALIEAAEVLRKVFRSSDLIARLGGDEFAILSYVDAEITTEQIFEHISKRIIKYSEVFNNSKKFEWILSISMGLILFKPWETFENIEELLSKADIIMYNEKKKLHKARLN